MRNVILVVDDHEVNRVILRELFEEEYTVLMAENGHQAMQLMELHHKDILLVLLDIIMPIMNGQEVLLEMNNRRYLADFPVVVLTADVTPELETSVFNLGVTDIIRKPFETSVVRRRVANIVELTRNRDRLRGLVDKQAEKLRHANETLVDTLATLIEYRSLETGQHTRRIRLFTQELLQGLAGNYPDYALDNHKIDMISRATALHDVGKIAIPDTILNKPGPLTPEERKIMETHTVKGAEILSRVDVLEDSEYQSYAYNICRFHHERWDGKGYPEGLYRSNIPICAQVAGLADCYDALTTDRVYKKAYPHDVAVKMILDGECGQFSPELLTVLRLSSARMSEIAASCANSLTDNRDDSISRDEVPTLFQDVSELGGLRYGALLRYLGCEIMELNLNSGVIHSAYRPSRNFEEFYKGESFSQGMEGFLEKSVHPEDRERLRKDLGEGLAGIFTAGLSRVDGTYRVFDRMTENYQEYSLAMLRVDLSHPHRRQLLLVWKRNESAKQEGAKSQESLWKSGIGTLTDGNIEFFDDAKFTLHWANDSFYRLIGYSRQEVREQFDNGLWNLIYIDDARRLELSLREQMGVGRDVKGKFRLMARDGSPVWVEMRGHAMYEGGRDTLCCILMNITDSIKEQEVIRRDLEKAHAVFRQIEGVIFEWDILKDEIHWSEFREKNDFGYFPKSLKELMERDYVPEDDLIALKKLVERVRAGMPNNDLELRYKAETGMYRWLRLRCTVQYDHAGRAVWVVGLILDVDEQKRNSELLLKKINVDSLTGFLNQSAMERQVREALSARREGTLSALFVLDIDDFTNLNRVFGHGYGNSVLVEVSSRVAKLFPKSSLISRVGGDEFLVFVPSIKGREEAERYCENLRRVFEKPFSDGLESIEISCSVGAALCPEHGESYDVLCAHADEALVWAKQQGKRRECIYSPGEFPVREKLPPAFHAPRTFIETGGGYQVVESLISQAFHGFAQSHSYEKVINDLLAALGRYYDVSRVYVFENNEDLTTCSNTFEWCNDGVSPQIEYLQNVDYTGLGIDLVQLFESSDTFCSTDVETLPRGLAQVLTGQGIQSIILCCIRVDGKFLGYVGFDDCMIHRIWPQEQVLALSSATRVIATFLVEKNRARAAETREKNLREVLNHIGEWMYVVEPETYKILFVNERTMQFAPQLKEKELTCHEAFFRCDTPCKRCPVRSAKEGRPGRMVIHNGNLGILTSAEATEITWGERPAWLVCCQDITGFQNEESNQYFKEASE